jgi:hypothetical protein
MMWLLRGYCCLILFTALFLPFADYSWWFCASLLATSLSWLSLLSRNFPFVNFNSVHFAAPFLFSIASHCLLTWEVIRDWTNGVFGTFAHFVFFIWAVPIFAMAAMFALDNTTQYETAKPNFGIVDGLRWVAGQFRKPKDS